MKQPHACIMKRTFGLYVLMSTLLLGSAIARADAVLDWNVIAVNTAIANNQNPFAQARYGAIVQLAVFEAVNSIVGDYHPYLGTVTAPPGASAEAAAIEAAHRVRVTYFPASKATLDAELANSLGAIPDGQAKTDGIAAGEAAASAMIALGASDGSSPPQFKIPGPPVPGEWQGTPSCPIVNGVAVGIAFQWQNITPFGIPSARDFLLDPPPAPASNKYAHAYNEVMTVGSVDSAERPQDRANVALFYAATSPTQIFNQAVQQVAQEQWRSLSENARTLALVNMAINDSLVASFLNKYHYNFWRPETAIHAGDTDGNPKLILIPALSPLSRLHVSRAIPPTTAAHRMAQLRFCDTYTVKVGITLRCQIPSCPTPYCNTRHSSRSPTTSPTRESTVGYIFEPIRTQASAWERL
jgi:hypothetical protein